MSRDEFFCSNIPIENSSGESPLADLNIANSPTDAIVREFFEETGMQIKVEKLLTGCQRKGRSSHQFDLFV